MTRALFVVALTVGLAAPLFGQSLADAARKAEQERAAKKTDGASGTKVYTNRDLKDAPALLTVAASPAVVERPAVAVKPEPGEETRASQYHEAAKNDEAYWQARMRDLQSALDTDQIRLLAMEGRVVSLTADFSRTDSVSDRLVLRREREGALTEVARLKAAVLADMKATSAAEEEARRAGVPPGWLRP